MGRGPANGGVQSPNLRVGHGAHMDIHDGRWFVQLVSVLGAKPELMAVGIRDKKLISAPRLNLDIGNVRKSPLLKFNAKTGDIGEAYRHHERSAWWPGVGPKLKVKTAKVATAVDRGVTPLPGAFGAKKLLVPRQRGRNVGNRKLGLDGVEKRLQCSSLY